jgi:hypothetical protein
MSLLLKKLKEICNEEGIDFTDFIKSLKASDKS